MGKWPPGTVITWQLDVTRLSDAEIAAVLAPVSRGIESWEDVCGIKFMSLGFGTNAELVVRFEEYLESDPSVAPDASQVTLWRNGVELGLTDEPVDPSPTTTLVMRLNTSPAGGWTKQKLEEVARHEAGHAIGLDHAPEGIVSCMSAYLDTRVTIQQPWEIGQAQALYGPPSLPPAEPPIVAPTPPADLPPPSPQPESKPVGVIATLLATSITPFLAAQAEKLIHDELAQGSPLNTAINNVLAKLESHIPDPNVRAQVDQLLRVLLSVVEGAVSSALPAA